MNKSANNRITEAADKKRSGLFNCAQSVVCTYCDRCGLSMEDAAAVSASFGTGMGNMEGTCGALVGAGIVLGLVTRDRNIARNRMKTIMEKFQARNGATQCKSLKGVGTGVVLRDCPDCVADAADFLEEFL